MNFIELKNLFRRYNSEINIGFVALNFIMLVFFGISNVRIAKISNSIIEQQNSLSALGLMLQDESNSLQEKSNEINGLLLGLTKQQTYISEKALESSQKAIYFTTKDSLDSKIISNTKYELLKSKLDRKEPILNKDLLADFLNNFEDVYMTCHRGILPKSDIKYTYEFLLGDICSNNDVINITQTGYGGLKKLCAIFFPKSKLAYLANMTTNNCK